MTDSTYLEPAHGLRTISRVGAWPIFLVLVALASVLPFAAVPFLQHVIPDTSAAPAILTTLVFVGANFHVAATSWFYTDKPMWDHFRSHPRRYLIAPGALIAGGAVLFHFIDPAQRGYLLIGFFGWQLWHYQKQNLGLVSFVAAGTDRVPLSAWERRTLALSAIAGILGFFKLYSVGLPGLSVVFSWAHDVGAGLYVLSPLAFVVALHKNPKLRANGPRLACLALGMLFFLPTFLFSDWISATLSYAVAHGLQYLVFMGFVAVGRPNPIASLVMLVGLGILGGLALNAAVLASDWPGFGYGHAAFGAFLGAVMAHFVLDAGLWRLREPFQRKYMRQRFHFIFNR
jgi:hypothetical protein